jgi:hypothetical protein
LDDEDMKTFTRWLTVPAAVAIAAGTAAVSLSQTMVAITPNSQTIELQGTSGGSKKDNSCAGYVSPSPNHLVQVAEDTNLRITLQSEGQPALLIQNPAGQSFCVPADNYSNGKINIPGRWTKGTYKIFVGDRANGRFPYTLSIARE